jgi:quercetin dioxygenase-like cupin family protein
VADESRFDRKELHMKTTRLIAAVALIGAGGLALDATLAQQPTTKRIDLQRHDLSIPGRETIQAIVEIAPGQASPRHTHPGEEIIYVLEGTLEYEIDGKVTKVKPGDVLFVPAGTPHLARNLGTSRGAELATYVVEKGKPLITIVQ